MEEQTNEFAINTCNVLYLLRAKCNDFSIEQLIEFRERLETTLIIHQKVYEKFHPLRWRYFRQKHLDSFPPKWRNEKSKARVFNPVYFMHDTLRTEGIGIDSLTEDEKIQIIAPLRENTSVEEQLPSIRITRTSDNDIIHHISPGQSLKLIKIKRNNTFEMMRELKAHRTLIFEELSSEERQEILDKISPPKNPISPNDIDVLSLFVGNRKLINRYNNNDPYDWIIWERDLYLIDSHCLLSVDENKDDYEYFFAWQLVLTDYFEIESFLQEQFEHSFLGNVEVFKKFIKILFKTYKHILTDDDNKEIVFEYIDNLKGIEKVVNEINMMEQDSKMRIKQEIEENTKKTLTQTQWVLVYYYFFKHLGLEVRKNIDISLFARFIHLATGTKFTKIQNSDINKKLAKVPNINTNRELVKDLIAVKSAFLDFGVKEMEQLIDNEIIKFKKELDSES